MITEKDMPVEVMRQRQPKNVCAQCGAPLRVAWGGKYKINSMILVCSKNAEHEGLMRPHEADIFRDQFASNRRLKELTQNIGEKKTETMLSRYNGVLTLTKPQATEIVSTLWPDAPAVEVYKAINIAVTYHLNPLLGHIYILRFWNSKDSRWEYSTGMDIKAKRLVASRRHTYSYMDFTPRLMSDEEEVKVYRKVDPTHVRSITILKDLQTGAIFYGYTSLPLTFKVHGQDKGNTIENMSAIHSESAALNRAYPTEVPPESEVQVLDSTYADPLDLNAKPRELFNEGQPAPAAAPATAKPVDVVDGTFTEVPPVEDSPPPAEPSLEPPAEKIDSAWLTESLKKLKWSEATTLSFIKAHYKVEAKKVAAAVELMSLEQAHQFAKDIEERLALV